MSFFRKLFDNKQPMDWKAFVTYYTDHASQQLGQPIEIEWGDDIEQTTIRLPDEQGGSMAVYLSNLYAQYCQSPNNLENLVTIALAAVMKAIKPNPPSDVQAHVFPMLKNREWVANRYEQIRQAYPDNDIKDNLLCTPIAGDLVVTYTLDSNNSLRYLTEKDLEEQQIAIEDIFELATHNFLHYMQERIELYQTENDALVILKLDGTYDASLLLYANALLAIEKLPFANYFVCAVPARDAFIACSADNEEAIAQIREISAEFAEQSPYRVSDYLYRVKDGEITLFDQMPPQH